MKKKVTILAAALISLSAAAQWPTNASTNLSIMPQGIEAYSCEFRVADDGKVFVVYNTPESAKDANVTYWQHFDKDGNVQVADKGQMIADKKTMTYTLVGENMFLDKDNNTIIPVTDCRHTTLGVKDNSYTIYKVSPTGEMLWGEDGIELDTIAYPLVAQMSIVQLSDGNYAFAYCRLANNNSIVVVQVLNQDGERVLEQELIIGDETNYCGYPTLIDAGNSQLILFYTKGAGKDFYARKIDFDGSSVWANDLKIYEKGGFGDIPLHTNIVVKSDNNGGMFVQWYDDRDFTNFEKVYLSHVKADGTLGFTTGDSGTRIGYSEYFRNLSHQFVASKDGNVYSTWRELSKSGNFMGIRAQKISPNGELLWGENGVEIAEITKDTTFAYITVQDAGDSIAVFYQQRLNAYGAVESVMTLRNKTNGAPAFANEDFIFIAGDAEYSNLKASQMIDSTYFVTMYRGGDGERFLKTVHINGTFDGVSTSVEPEIEAEADSKLVYENSANGKAQFSIVLDNNSDVNVNIYSVTGQLQQNVFVGTMDAGRNQFTTNQLQGGVYIVSATINGEVHTEKIIIK